MSPRGPKSRVRPRPRKGGPGPAAVVGLPNRDHQFPPAFSFEHADIEYNDAWSWWTDDEAPAILRFLCEISTRTWSEIMAKRRASGGMEHHLQEIADVCPAAQARITERGLDQLAEMLFRFGVGDRGRLWGFATDGVFYVLWWDRDHQVCPVD
jgi:hypothetical protein